MDIIATPLSYRFNSDEEQELRRVLQEIDQHTLVIPVASTNDLMLKATGRTVAGDYQYSNGALLQLCAIVAPGLAQLVLDVAGHWRKPGEDRRLFSEDLAVDILNRAIRLRFDRKLLGLQLVRNTKLKIVDGIVGTKYRYLANSDFLERIAGSCGQRRARFHEACLYGRHLIVRYVNQPTTPEYTIAGDAYTFGYHFANSEIGGRSVRAATVLVRCATGDCALCPFTGKSGGRVVHSGRDFERRLHTLFDQIVRSLPLKTDVEAGGDTIEAKSLHLGAEEHERRVRYLIQMLTRRKLTQDFARRVVSSAASKGRDKDDSLIDQLPTDQRLILTQRSGYDLFTALIREAKLLPIDQREIAEQVAYALLTNKIWLSE